MPKERIKPNTVLSNLLLQLSLSIQVGTGIIYLEKPETIFPSGKYGWLIKTDHAKMFWESQKRKKKCCLICHQILRFNFEGILVSSESQIKVELVCKLEGFQVMIIFQVFAAL